MANQKGKSMSQELALQRLSMMGDWLPLKTFDHKLLLSELGPFKNDWKKYNPSKPINRWGLSVTSLDGELSGIPDLDSLGEYNKRHNKNYTNSDINRLTPVFEKSPTLQKILNPYLPWLGRCHFIRLDTGGFFPEHYDINKLDYNSHEIRLIGFVNNNDISRYKFCYENCLIQGIQDGKFYYFNAHKHHSVFSFVNNCIQLIVCLRFDQDLFKVLIENYQYR